MSDRSVEPGPEEPWSKAGRLFPAATGILLLALVLAMWRTLALQETEALRNKVKAESDYLASLVDADLRNRIPALQRMARSWAIRTGTPRDEFYAEARSYFSDAPGFQAIERVDAASVVRWVIPLEGNEKAVGLDLSFEKNRKEAMGKARDGHSPAMTVPIDLVQGGKGFLVFFPLEVRGEFDGYLLAAFRIREWMGYVLGVNGPRALSEDFRVAALFDGKPIYEQEGWAALGGEGEETSSARILDHVIYLQVRPTEAFIKGNTSLLPRFVVAFGSLVSILVACVVRLYQRSTSEVRRARAAKAELESEARGREEAERELHAAFARVDWATKAARMGVWTWDLATDKLTWNDRMFELFDVPPDVEPVYDTWRSMVLPEDLALVEPLLRRAVEGKAVFDTEFRCRLSDGSIRHVRAAARVERDADGGPKAMTGLNWDVTEAKGAEAALKESEARVRLLLDSTGEAIYGLDLEGNCSFANPSCARILGYQDPALLIGKNMHDLIHHSYADGQPMPIERCRVNAAFRDGMPVHADDEVFWRADGSSFPVEYWSYPQVSHNAVAGAVVAFIDISERRRAEETIRHMATHDGLTDLPSLRLYRDRLEMAMSSARRNKAQAAVMFLDLDGFKQVNDGFGHDAGDEVLKEAAARLRSALRETDTVSRSGGDEFLLVLTDLQSPEGAAQIAGKILQLIAQPFRYKGSFVTVGASIGISIFPRDAEGADELIKLADEAMYSVKKAGKNSYSFAGEA